MITQPFGLPETSFCASVSKVVPFGSQLTWAPILPPIASQVLTKTACSAVPKSSSRAPTLTVAPLPNASSAAPASAAPWKLSEGSMRQTLRVGPMPALRLVIAGEDAVGEMRSDAARDRDRRSRPRSSRCSTSSR